MYKVVPNKLKDPDFSEMTATLESSHSTIQASAHREQSKPSANTNLKAPLESELTNISKIMAVDEILMSRDESGDINLCKNLPSRYDLSRLDSAITVKPDPTDKFVVTNRSNMAQEFDVQAKDHGANSIQQEGKRSFIGSGDEKTIKKEDFMKQFNLEAVRAEMNRIKENKANFDNYSKYESSW